MNENPEPLQPIQPVAPSHTLKATHIDEIRVGDVVEFDGHLRTVGKDNLKHGGFLGTTLWGDSFASGSIMVMRVIYPTFYKGKSTSV